jgi:hypothetical protein
MVPIVFLLGRLIVGAVVAWEASQRLTPYGAKPRDFRVATTGLLLLIGAVAIVTGLGVVVGVAALLAALLMDGFARATPLRRSVVFTIATLVLLLVPRPWPFTLFG